MTANDTRAAAGRRTANEIDREAAGLVDVEMDDHGRQRPDVPRADRDYFEALSQASAGLRELLAAVIARDRRPA